MKKTLIALAAVAATGAAFAQSSVTIYGRMDLGFNSSTTETNSALVTGATEVSSEKTKASSLGAQNSRTTSRLGFTGTEDLGGGLKAGFAYEIGLAPDNIGQKVGTSDKALASEAVVGFGITRLANLSLSGGFGTVVLGTFLNAHDSLRGYSAATFNMPGGDFLARHNANQADAPSTAGATFVSGAHTTIANLLTAEGDTATAAVASSINGIGLNARSANSVAYRSPTMGGFSVGLGMVNDSTKTTPNEKADTRKVSGQSLSVNYAQGPISAIVVHGAAKNKDLDKSTTGKTTDWGFAVSYNLGVAIPYIQHESVKATNSGLTGVSLKTAATEVGARFPMGAFTPYVSVGTGTYKIAGVVDEAVKFKQTAFQVGTTYDLSKRTQAYVAIGQDKQKFEEFSVKRSGMALGLVHQF